MVQAGDSGHQWWSRPSHTRVTWVLLCAITYLPAGQQGCWWCRLAMKLCHFRGTFPLLSYIIPAGQAATLTWVRPSGQPSAEPGCPLAPLPPPPRHPRGLCVLKAHSFHSVKNKPACAPLQRRPSPQQPRVGCCCRSTPSRLK